MRGEGGYHLILPARSEGYADAQIDDHRRLKRSAFPWRPPVRLRLRARASESNPPGTLGFGLWNDPFSLSLGQGGAARRLPSSPGAAWFFYASAPADLALAPGAPPNGWKASCLNAPWLPPWLLAPAGAIALGATHIPFLRRRVLRRAIDSLRASEVVLSTSLDEWHDYEVDWRTDRALFRLDGRVVLEAASPPGPLGFVAWIDNQYAIASPEKGFRFGVLPTHRQQGLELSDLSLSMVPAAG